MRFSKKIITTGKMQILLVHYLILLLNTALT